MARYLPSGRPDHTAEITRLRLGGAHVNGQPYVKNAAEADADLLAADLLEMHDQTGISLDHWDNAQRFIARRLHANGIPAPWSGDLILPNGA